MTTITNFSTTDQAGEVVLSDPFGNNVAFQCADCKSPVLAIVRAGQRGASAEKPATCRGCGASYWVEVVESERRLTLHRVLAASGRYVLARAPSLTAGPNKVSWAVVSAILQAYGGADYADLAAAVSQHDQRAGGRAFIDYCIRNGWLERS